MEAEEEHQHGSCNGGKEHVAVAESLFFSYPFYELYKGQEEKGAHHEKSGKAGFY